MNFLLLLMLGAIAVQVPKSAGPMLIFEFPDGARGGHGKILGTAKPVWSKELGSSLPEDTVAKLNRCGLKDARLVDWRVSHRGFVVGRSSHDNERIVRCYKKHTYRHFNVGIGRSWPFEFDDSAFRKYWKKSKAYSHQVSQ